MMQKSHWWALVLVAAMWCRGTFGSAATEVKIQIFNVHVDEYATKAVITWETSIRTNTFVRWGLTTSYGREQVNPTQTAETIHSLTLEGLTPATTYHYAIEARDPFGAAPLAKSADMSFVTSKTDTRGDAQGKENAGLVNLTKSYVDKLTRMTPDEREQLKSSIQKFTGPSSVGTVNRDNRARKLSAILDMAPKAQPRPAPPLDKSVDRLVSSNEFAQITDNAFQRTEKEPLSTFSIDVDTASYAMVRRFLNDGNRPPRDSVRIEELINNFVYTYPAPDEGETLTAHAEVAGCPWQPEHKLLKVGLKGKEVDQDKRPDSNLVFLIDVSGSMSSPDRLPLVIQSMKLLLTVLRARDRVAIVVYAGAAGVVLPPTAGDQTTTIAAALERLHAGGSTNGAGGLELAYQTAKASFIKGGVNRVILCSDGDFNVGMVRDALVEHVAMRAKDGVFLTVLGFGMGNLNDRFAEQLADRGNGNYAYIDGLKEARKVLVQQAGGTLQTIAKDVKLQLEFNPKTVAGYRLIGYENRLLAAQDFNDDKKDAGELGAGHTVTALYELVPAGKSVPQAGATTAPAAVDPLRYQKSAPSAEGAGELLTLKLRYKQPAEEKSRLLQFHVGDSSTLFEKASVDMRFAAAVASFGMLLRESPHKGSSSFDGVATIAESALGADPGGYRHDFFALVNKARAKLK